MDSQTESRNLLLTLLAVVLATIITGGVVYAIQNKQNDDTKAQLQSQINTLKQQMASNQQVTVTPAPNACDTSLSLASLKNASVVTDPAAIAANSYKLTNGTYQSSSIAISLKDSIACDSVSNNDVAAIVTYNNGGTGTFYILETFSPKGSQPVMTAMTILGDRVVIKSLSMADGLITVDMLTQGPNDSAAQPTLDTKVEYKLPASGTTLIKQ